MGLCREAPISEILSSPIPMTDAQVQEHWYDWFCKDTSLVNKGRRLFAKLQTIAPSPRFDAKTSYVFFKNNCPCNGSLYDDFRICSIATSDVLYCVVPAEGYTRTKGEACVWGKAFDGEWGELARGTWKDVKKFFQATEAEVVEITKTVRWTNMVRDAELENAHFDREQRYKKWQAEREARNVDLEYREQLEHLLGVSI